MSPQDIANISQWLQQILTDVRDIHLQTQDMRGEMKTAANEASATSKRIERGSADTISLLSSIQTQINTLKSDLNTSKSNMESKLGDLERQVKDLRSAVASLERRLH